MCCMFYPHVFQCCSWFKKQLRKKLGWFRSQDWVIGEKGTLVNKGEVFGEEFERAVSRGVMSLLDTNQMQKGE